MVWLLQKTTRQSVMGIALLPLHCTGSCSSSESTHEPVSLWETLLTVNGKDIWHEKDVTQFSHTKSMSVLGASYTVFLLESRNTEKST